jgi:hypothetical protein
MKFSLLTCTLLLVVTSSQFAPELAANASPYPLEITNIRPDLGPNSRIKRAYPGLVYNVRAAVIGGRYPYNFQLNDAPAGMQVNEKTGEITWLNPKANATPTLVVVDSDNTRRTIQWTITVGTSGFKFVDAVNGKPSAAGGTGTASAPWQSLADVYAAGRPGEFVYFKNGTYGLEGIPRSSVGTPWERVAFAESQRPVVWLAYPDHQPTIDFARGAANGALVRLRGDNVYIDGFETVNSRIIAFQFEAGSGIGPTFRRLRMHKLGPGIDGSNAAFIMTLTAASPANYMVVQDSEFFDVTGEAVTIKIYAQQKLLIEDTVHRQATIGIELKDDIRQFTVRRNQFDDIKRTAIGGNMHEISTHGEILFNNVRATVALDLNQDGMAGRVDAYRNTLVGRVQVRNTDSADGPFRLANNVIVSADLGVRGSRVNLSDVADPSRVIIEDNLVGGPNEGIVDLAGNLTGPSVNRAGKVGHVIAVGVK